MDTGQNIAYDGLLRAARLAASIAGASGADVEEIADEAMARLLMQDGLVNNPKAWLRRTAMQLAAQAQARQRIQTDDVLEELTATERSLVLAHRSGYSVRELGQRLRLSEEGVGRILSEANRKVRRSSRRLTDSAG